MGTRLEDADEVWVPLPVLAEAYFAALNSGRRRENRARLDDFLRGCRIAPMGPETALRYAQLRLALQRKGRPIPANDMWIAGVCLERNLPLATRNGHFDHVDGLERLAW